MKNTNLKQLFKGFWRMISKYKHTHIEQIVIVHEISEKLKTCVNSTMDSRCVNTV